MTTGAKLKLIMNPTARVLRDKGLAQDGDVQRFHTANVLRRIVRYMPYRTGVTIKLTVSGTDINKPYIVTEAPYAKYLYYGKSQKGTVTYTRTKNPKAGPYWDRALAAAEGAAITADLQRYIKSKR